MKTHNLTLPLSPAEIDKLKINDKVLLTGYLFTARDVAHKRMMEIIQKGEVLPFELSEIALFYCGPTPWHRPAARPRAGLCSRRWSLCTDRALMGIR